MQLTSDIIEMEDNVLPNFEDINDCKLFEDDLHFESEGDISNGLWSTSPEDASLWMEKSSVRFSQ